MLAGADWCGNHPGDDTDKSAAIPSHPGEKLNVPIPDDSPWSYELQVVKTLPLARPLADGVHSKMQHSEKIQ